MKVFITGATGYVGGSIAVHLIKAGHSVRGLVRDMRKADALAQLGVEAVQGDLDDRDVLIREARAADAVINCASSDHRDAIEALLEGLAGSGKPLLHTSGSSVIGDAVAGNALNPTIFDEETPLVVDEGKRARHELDRRILSAEGIRGVVICNTLIYGKGLGLQPHSVQIPALADKALASGVVRIVGRGLNRWSTVHIEDACVLYLLALEQAPAGAFYFAENGESSFADIGAALGKRLGITAIENLDEEQAIAIWGVARARYSLGSNSRVHAVRARKELGWRPRHASATAWIENEMDKPA